MHLGSVLLVTALPNFPETDVCLNTAINMTMPLGNAKHVLMAMPLDISDAGFSFPIAFLMVILVPVLLAVTDIQYRMDPATGVHSHTAFLAVLKGVIVALIVIIIIISSPLQLVKLIQDIVLMLILLVIVSHAALVQLLWGEPASGLLPLQTVKYQLAIPVLAVDLDTLTVSFVKFVCPLIQTVRLQV